MFKMSVGYPNRADEDEILARRVARKKDAVEVETITDPARVVAMQEACEDVYVDPAVRMYMVETIVQGRERTRVCWSAHHLVDRRPYLKTSQPLAGNERKRFHYSR